MKLNLKILVLSNDYVFKYILNILELPQFPDLSPSEWKGHTGKDLEHLTATMPAYTAWKERSFLPTVLYPCLNELHSVWGAVLRVRRPGLHYCMATFFMPQFEAHFGTLSLTLIGPVCPTDYFLTKMLKSKSILSIHCLFY